MEKILRREYHLKTRLLPLKQILHSYKLLFICVLVIGLILFAASSVFRIIDMQKGVFSQMTICKDCKAKSKTGNQPFPKILHQTWKNSKIPDKWRKSSQSCREKNPDYNYLLWTDNDLEELINKHYSWFLSTYKGYKYNIQRADAGRYFILYHYGGAYTDLDIICQHSFEDILRDIHHYDVVIPQGPPVGITAEVMIVKARHPYMEYVIRSLQQANKWYVFPYATIMFSTGPMFLSNCFVEYPHKEQFYIIPYELYTQMLFGNLHGGSWHEWDGDLIFWIFTHRYTVFLSVLVTILLCFKLYHKYRAKV